MIFELSGKVLFFMRTNMDNKSIKIQFFRKTLKLKFYFAVQELFAWFAVYYFLEIL